MVEALKKEVEKLENREKQNEWFIMTKQLEDSLTQSNHNLLALNKKVHALEIEKEAMESEYKRQIKKTSEAEEERREELQTALDSERKKVRQLKTKLEAKEDQPEPMPAYQGYGSNFQDRRRMLSEKMEFEDRLTRKEVEIQSYEREVEKYKEKLAASEEQKQKRKIEYRRELEKQEKENATLRKSIHELELDN